MSAIKERQYQPSAPKDSDLVSDRIRDSLVLLQHLLDGALPAIEDRVDNRPRDPRVIILSDAMWDKTKTEIWDPGSGPHGFGRMAWIVWIPPSDFSDGELVYASQEASTELLRWSNELKPKKTFIVFLEVMALAAPYFSPDLADKLKGRDVWKWTLVQLQYLDSRQP